MMKLIVVLLHFVNTPHNSLNVTTDNKFYSQSMLMMKLCRKKQQIQINLQACNEMISWLHYIILFQIFLLNLWLRIKQGASKMYLDFHCIWPHKQYLPGIWKCNVNGFLLLIDDTSNSSPFLSTVIFSLSSFSIGSFSNTITLFWSWKIST